MIWLHLDEADPNRVRQLIPIGWEGRVKTESGQELDATLESWHGVTFCDESGEAIDDVVAVQVQS